MNKTVSPSFYNRKRFKVLCLAVIIIFVFFTLFGCNGETLQPSKIKYRIEMGVKVRTLWPEYDELIYYASKTDASALDRILTEQNNELNLIIEGRKRVSIEICFYIINEDTEEIIETRYPVDTYPGLNLYLGQYSINKKPHQLIKSIYSNYDRNILGDTVQNFELSPISGSHIIKFNFPVLLQYNILERKEFLLHIDINSDNRKPVQLKAKDSENYTKYTADLHDVFVMRNTLESGKPFLPEIGVYNGDSVLISPAIPTEWNEETTVPHVKAWFRKVNDYCADFSDAEKTFDPFSYPKEPGLYAVAFTFTGDEIYQPTEYSCFIVIP